jgi:hypothetical protein
MKPDVLKGAYASEMDPTQGPRKLPPSEAAHQRAAAQAIRAAGFPDPVQSFRLSTDAYSFPSSEPAKTGSEPQRVDKPATRSRVVADSTPPQNTRQSTPVSSDTEDLDGQTEDQKRLARYGKKKAAASPRAPADKKGQESPEAKASHPMATRQHSSRAGSSRCVVGSGQTDTRVSQRNPSKT